jgi:hypothetical protein
MFTQRTPRRGPRISLFSSQVTSSESTPIPIENINESPTLDKVTLFPDKIRETLQSRKCNNLLFEKN